MQTPSHLIIYDRSNYDSLICAAIQKYQITQDYPEDEIVAVNWDELPYTASTNIKTIKQQCKSITLCATIIDTNILRIMYNAIFGKFLSIQCNPLYKDIVAGISQTINQLFEQRQQESKLAQNAIFNVSQSATLTLYKYIYKDTEEIPLFYQYLDGFITDSYYEYDFKRDEVIQFEKGLCETFHNDFDIVYTNLIELYEPNNIPYDIVDTLISTGEPILTEVNEYILNHFKKYGGVVWEGNNRGGIIRKVLPLFTSEKLSKTLLTNELLQDYDSIVTFNQLKTGQWEMCLYNILHPVIGADFNNLTIEQRRTILLNTFSAGIYMKNVYKGMGNDICGWAYITNTQFCNLCYLKKV